MAATAQPVWDATRRAEYLTSRRDELVRRLPARIRIARRFTRDLHELIVDDAIEFTALRHDRSVPSARDLERVFWDAALTRAKQAADGRHDTVRAGHARADPSALDGLDDHGAGDPAVHAQAAWEASWVRELYASLDEREQLVLRAACTSDGPEPAGYKVIARTLGWSVGEVRSLQARIDDKGKRFAVITAAGRLCEWRAPVIAATAAGEASQRERAIAHAHLAGCAACTEDYLRQLRYLRSARFRDQIAQLLPPVTATNDKRARTGIREFVSDWIARLLGHDAPAAALHLSASGAGRGLGAAAALKLAALCTGGAMTACVATGVLPLPTIDRDPPRAIATATPSATSTPHVPEPRLPHGAVRVTPTPTPKPKPKPRPKRTRPTSPRRTAAAATQGATGARSHEQTPASPAPADAAPGGASEFDPSYQPSAPAAPAPVPAAPGASEFN